MKHLLIIMSLITSPVMAGGSTKVDKRVKAVPMKDTRKVKNPTSPRLVNFNSAFNVQLKQEANKIVKYTLESNDPIDILIDSNGGLVNVLRYVLDYIRVAKARGIIVNCYVVGKAYSAGSYTFNECTNRYSTRNAYFMFHSVRGGCNAGPGTPYTFKRCADELERTTNPLKSRLMEELQMDNKLFEKLFKDEAFLPATVLKGYTDTYLTIVDDLPDHILKASITPKKVTPTFNIFGG